MQEQHDTVVAYVNSPIGTSAAGALRRPVGRRGRPDHRLRQYVQADAVKAGLTGADAALPVLSIAAPFNRSASFPAGEVTVRDAAGLYIYDNTLLAVKVTGAQVKDYLEYSARYFKQVSGTGPFPMAQVTNAVTPTGPNGTPGLQLRLGRRPRCAADLRHRPRPAGRVADPRPGVRRRAGRRRRRSSRWRSTTTASPAAAASRTCATAPVVYNRQNEIRQLLIDWVIAHQVIDPAQFASVDWRLTSGGQPITVV